MTGLDGFKGFYFFYKAGKIFEFRSHPSNENNPC